MLSLSRRLGITPRPDHDEYDPAAAGWLDSGRPEGARQEAVHQAFVPQQWAGTSAVRDRERANHAADGHAAGGHRATARGPHPLGLAEPEAAPPWASAPAFPAGPADTQPIKRQQAPARRDGAWPEICDQFGSHLLVLAEQVRASLNVLEAGEDDPERLKRLYQVDHAVTRMRLASRQLRALAGRDDGRLAGFTTSLLDLIRMASSAIEWYPEVSVGPVVELAVPGYAADDVATLLSALLDNATKYSPGTVTVSCHLLQEGGVMFRIEDTGIGIGRDKVRRLNAAFVGPVPEVDESTARHVGFPVVHRIASKHSIGVRFASRRPPATGTLAMVILPPQLLCAIPAQPAPRPPAAAEPPGPPTAAAEPAAPPTAAGALPELPRRERSGLVETASAETVSVPTVSVPTASVQAAPLETAPLETAPPAMSPDAVPAEAASPEMMSPEAVSPEALSAEQDHDVRPCELPRRAPASLGGDEQRPAEAAPPSSSSPPPQQAAARNAFADELSAFSQGIEDALAARGITGGLVGVTSDGASIEEAPGHE
jgi:Histidine kinase-, DNA gyrase B-, and HSP90-like ATPase